MNEIDAPETLSAIPKLPLFKTVHEAYQFTFAHAREFLLIAWAWLLIGAVVMFALGWFVFWPAGFATKADFSSDSFVLQSLPSILDTFIGASLAVTWHRFVLLNEAPSSAAPLRIDKLVRTYFAWALALAAITWAFVLFASFPVTQFVSSINLPPPDQPDPQEPDLATSFDIKTTLLICAGAYLLGAPFMFLPTRMSLKLPAVALSRSEVTARESWLRTHGNFWRLYTGTWASVLPVSLVITLLININEKTRLGYALNQSIGFLIGIIAGMIGITFLSLAFRHFFGETSTQRR